MEYRPMNRSYAPAATLKVMRQVCRVRPEPGGRGRKPITRFDVGLGSTERDDMAEDDHEIRALLEELTRDLREALGPELRGLYVYGSFVSGGFDAGVSDLDLIAVTRT